MKLIHTFAAALAASSVLSGAAFAATKVGVIGAANPQVYVEREDGTKRLLNVGDDVFLGDNLTTDAKGSAQLMFLDKSALTISPDSAVSIDTFIYDPAAKDGTMTVNGAKGAFRFIGGALTKKKAVNLKTPVSTIGIRGGIVDTHIAPTGQTDAVFLFGKEMTMTNAGGQTTSTTQFGTGIGLANAGALPVSLPQNVVAAHIASSPTQAAVAAAPPASPAQINALEGKVTMNSASKSSAPATGGEDAGQAPAPASSDGGGADNGGADNGGGNNDSGGENTSSAPAAKDASPANAPDNGGAASDENNGGGGAGGNGGAAKPAAPAPEASSPNAAPASAAPKMAAPKMEAPANAPSAAPAPAAPKMPAGMAGGLKAGAGMKPMAMVAAPAAPIATPAMGGETLYAKIDTFMNGDETAATNETPKLFNVQKAEATLAQPSGSSPASNRLNRRLENAGTGASFRQGAQSPEGAPELEPIAGLDQTDSTLAPPLLEEGAGLEAPQPGDETPPIVSAPIVTQTVATSGSTYDPNRIRDLFGGSTDWSAAAPTLAEPATKRGRFFVRDNSGAAADHINDKIDVAKAAGFIGTSDTTDANYHAKLDGKHVIVLESTERHIGDYSTAGSGVTSGDASNYVVGTLDIPAGSGLKALSDANVHFEDAGGIIETPSLSGFAYETSNGSFGYTQLSWIENSGEIVDVRGYLLSSALDGVTDATTAKTAYTTMLTNSAGYASSTGGIIEYDFLPELAVQLDASGYETFGQLDYNHVSGLSGYGYASAPSSYGLFVDYNNKKFLGGHVDFLASSPTIQTLFGKVNNDTSIGFDAGKSIATGDALQGSVYHLKQTYNFDAGNNSALDVNVKAQQVASGTGANEAIEALVVQTRNGADLHSQQAAVIGDGANASLLDSAPISETVYGYSAGLITDNSGNVSSIQSHSIGDVSVQTNAQGTVLGTVKYYESNTVGAFNEGTSQTLKFGGSAVHNAALQNDLYAAEVNNGLSSTSGSASEGVIISMHEATSSQSSLVCSSCEFSHWGVWQADHIDANGDVTQQSAVVPYVVGEKTTEAQLLDTITNAGAYGIANINAVTYTGDIAANALIGGGISNVTGQFEAVIDIDNRRLTTYYANANGVEFGFNTNDAAYTTSLAGSPGIAASTHAAIGTNGNEFVLNSNNLEGYSFDSSTARFNAPVVGVGSTASNDVTGHLNGTLYGDQAQEVGGNFNVEHTPSGEQIGGIFQGTR